MCVVAKTLEKPFVSECVWKLGICEMKLPFVDNFLEVVSVDRFVIGSDKRRIADIMNRFRGGLKHTVFKILGFGNC